MFAPFASNKIHISDCGLAFGLLNAAKQQPSRFLSDRARQGRPMHCAFGDVVKSDNGLIAAWGQVRDRRDRA